MVNKANKIRWKIGTLKSQRSEYYKHLTATSSYSEIKIISDKITAIDKQIAKLEKQL